MHHQKAYLYICIKNPKRAKKLYKEIVSKRDEYLELLQKTKNQDELQLLMNPLWHVHNRMYQKNK